MNARTLLTDEDVFGPQSQPGAPRLLSDDEVMGATAPPPEPAADEPRDAWTHVKDIAAGGLGALTSIAKLPAMAADRAISGRWMGPGVEALTEFGESVREQQSPQRQAHDAADAQRAAGWGAATRALAGKVFGEDSGATTAAGEIASGAASFGGALVRPDKLIEQAPFLLASRIGGLATQGAVNAGAKALPAAAATRAGQAAVSGAGTVGAVGSGAAMQGADIGSGAYERLMELPDELWQQTPKFAELAQLLGPDEAKALLASDKATMAALQAGLASLLSTALPGGASIERAMMGKALTGKTAAQAVGKAFAGEAVQEGVEEGYGALAANEAVRQVNPNQSLAEGIGSAVGEGAALGGLMGGGMATVQHGRELLRAADSVAPPPAGAAPAAPPAPANAAAAAVPDLERAATDEALAELNKPPVELTALDRVQQLDAEIAAAAPAGTDTTALQAERAALAKSFPAITPGAATTFSTETGARLEGQYALIDINDLQPSHDSDLKPNPAYPQALQPRERDRAASAMQIQGIVSRLDPARLGESATAAEGAPIIGADGLVESGNARTIALRRVYAANGLKATQYRQWLTENADRFGLAAEQIEGMRKPVLVRVRSTPVNRAEFARQANAPTVAVMSPREQALSDAARIDTLDDLRPTDDGEFASSRDFIRRFVGGLSQTERGAMVDADGRLSSSGYARARNAVLAKAFGDSPVLTRLVESMDDTGRNIAKALVIAAPRMAQVRAMAADGRRHNADLTPALVEAASELEQLRQSGRGVDEALQQQAIDGQGRSPEAAKLLRFMADNARRPRRVADLLQAYADALDAAGDPAQGDLLGGTEPPSVAALLDGALREVTANDAAAPQATEAPQAGEAAPAVGADAVPAAPAAVPGSAAAAVETGGVAAPGAANDSTGPDWVQFAPESGTLGIPRAQMPQVKMADRGAMVNFLKARGIEHEIVEVDPAALKPTQAEFSRVKTRKAMGATGDTATALVSADGYVIDGHHRWLAQRVKGEPVRALRFNAPAMDVLDAIHAFPSSTTSPDSDTDPRRVAVQDFKDALADLGDFLTRHQRAAIVQEHTPEMHKILVRLFDSAVRILGTDLKRAIAWVKQELKANPDTKKSWNKITAEEYRKAALEALENVQRGAAGEQPGLFDGEAAASEALQGDLFSGPAQAAEPKAAPSAAMIDGRPYDAKRDNFAPPSTDGFIPAEVLDRAREQIKRLRKAAEPEQISDPDRAKAESLLRPLIQRAEEAKAAYDQKIIDIAKSAGALGQMLAPVKSLDSATRKLVNEAGFDTGKMYDMLRSTIVVSSYAEAQGVLDAIRGEFEVLPGRVKNMTDAKIDGKAGRFMPSGYGQVLVNAKTPGGAIAEIQINVPEMLAIKLAEGHSLYKIERAEMDGSPARAEAVATQREIYPLAAAAATARNDSSLEELEPGDSGKSRAGDKNISPVASSSPNTRPSGNLTNSAASPLVPNSQPSGNLSGTFIGPDSTSLPQDSTPGKGAEQGKEEGAEARDDQSPAAHGTVMLSRAKAYTGGYDTDLFGEPVPAPARAGQRAESGRAGVRRNVDAAPDVPGDTPAPAGDYHVRTTVGATAQRQLGASVIETAADAAAATRYLYRSAVERFDGIVTDKNGKPLAVVGGFKGALSQASVYPATVIGEAVRIRGAAKIWFSHNHPSGSAALSRADESLNETLSAAFRGSGIEPMGLLAVAGSRFAYVAADGSQKAQYAGPSNDTPDSAGSVTVPVIERELHNDGAPREQILSPTDAKRAAGEHYRAAGRVPGIMLLDSQHGVIGWVPLSPQMLGALRDTGGLNAIYRAVSESNAGAAILVHGGELDAKVPSRSVTLGENIGAALGKVDVRALDIINATNGESAAQQGQSTALGPVFSRSGGQGIPAADLGALAARVRKRMPGLPRVHVLQSPADAPQRLLAEIERRDAIQDVEGAYFEGEIFMFASNLQDPVRAEHVLAEHEAAHAGLAGLLGAGRAQAMQAIYNQNAGIRRVVKPMLARGMSVAEAVEEAIVDMPTGRLARLRGWRAVVGLVRDSLRRLGLHRLADNIDGWLAGHLTDQQRADLVVADLVRGARAFVARKRASRVSLQPATAAALSDGSLAEDAQAQEKWLNAEARARGYKDIDDLAEKAYPVFEKLAELWRKKHPADALMSRGAGGGFGRGEVVADFRNDVPLKEHADYRAAKGGDVRAAANVVRDLVKPASLDAARQAFGDDVVYVPVQAEEAAGRNKLPAAMAQWYAANAGGSVADGVVQANRAFHTGANAMERLIARAQFAGPVTPGARYVLVDDVTTMGSTLADFAAYIRAGGGEVAGAVVLVNALRGGKMTPDAKTARDLEARHGDEIRKQFGIAPGALTAEEARYLIGFRSTDELRNRVAAARRSRSERLAAQGLREGQDDGLTRLSRSPQAGGSPGAAAGPAGPVGQQRNLPGIQPATPANSTPPTFPTHQMRLGLPVQPGWSMPEGTRFDDFAYKLQDKQIDLKRAVGAIVKQAKQIEDRWDAYLQEELFHERAAKRTQDFVRQELEPLLADMKGRGVTQDALDAYLHARHAKEANKLIADRNPEIPDGGSGMTDAAADAHMAGLTPARKADLAALAAKVDAIIAKTRDTYVGYGLESRAVVDGWAKMFKHYVPLMREDHDGGMGIGQGFSVRGDETKHRTGSTAKVVDILANIALQREKAIVRGEKNRVAVALAGLARLNPNPEVWTFGAAPQEQVFNPKTGQVEWRVDPLFKTRANAMVAKIPGSDGKIHERAVIFNERNERAMRMVAALKNMDATTLEGLIGVSAKITRYFAAINTQYNPVFGAVNLVRDVQGALINLNSTPLAAHRKAILQHTASALKGIYIDSRASRAGKAAASPWAGLWEEFQLEGGATGFRDLYRTSADRAKAIERALDPHKWMQSPLGQVFTAGGSLKVPVGVAQDKAGWLFDWLSDYNQSMENSVRLAAYKVGLEQGMSKQRAASLAKNLTVNFNRRGQIGMQAGAMYAFFNAATQGTARMADVLFDMRDGDLRTLRLSKIGKRIVAGGIMLGAMNALMLAAAGFDDEEPPEFVRERNLVIPVPFGNKKYIAIPMPLGWHVLPNLGRVPTEFMLRGFKDPAKHVIGLVGILADAFNPIGNAGLSIQTVAPTALDPLVALTENRDWTGRPIAAPSFNDTAPGFSRAKDTATTPARWIAEAINWMSGGTQYKAGAWSPTPDQIDYLWGQVTGGVGRESAKVEQTVKSLLTGEELPPHKIPLVGRFFGDAAGASGQSGQFYTNLKVMEGHEAQIKGLALAGAQAGSAAEADELFTEREAYMKENPEAWLWGRATVVQRQVRALRDRKRDAVKADAPRAEVKEIEDEITRVMREFNEEVRAEREPKPTRPPAPARSTAPTASTFPPA